MAVKQRIIKATISGGVNLRHDDIVKFYVYSDTGAPSRSSVSGDSLNYDIYSSGGYLGDGIQYSKISITGCNGGTSKWCWFQFYFDKTSDYDLATVGLPDGINSASINGTSINLDENDSPDDAFEALFAPTPTYVAMKFCREDESTSTNGLTLKDDSELIIYMGYNTVSATLTNPGTPTITQNSNGTYTASWTAATGSNGSGSVYYQLWDPTNNGYWSNWSTSTSRTLNIPSYGVAHKFQVRASYDGASSSSAGSVTTWSGTTTKTFTAPSVTKPGAPTITQNSDGTFKATWTASTGSNGSGSVSYQLYYGSTAIGNSTTGTTVTANIPGYGTTYSFTVKATYSGVTATSNATSFTFVSVSVTAPGKPSITTTTSQYTVTWTAATGSNGTGSVYYRVIVVKTDGSFIKMTDWQTGRTYTDDIPSSGEYSFTVEATYNNASSTTAGTVSMLSESVTTNLKLGSLTNPGKPTITQNYDGTFTATWTAATGSGNVGSVYYRLYNVTSGTYVTNRITELRATLNVPVYGTAQTYRVYATYGNASTSVNGEFTTQSSDTAITFLAPALTNPGAPTITQNNNGTFTVSWTKATGSYGQGDVYYQLWNGSTSTTIGDRITALTATYSITSYNVDTTYQIKATYNNASASADGSLITYSTGVSKTFAYPNLTAPVVSLASTSGTSAQLNWTAAQLSNATGTISYSILVGGNVLDYTSSTSYTIAESVIASLSPAIITVKATATGLSNTVNGATLNTTSNTVIFTYTNELIGASNLEVSGTNVANLSWTAGSTSFGTLVYDIYAGNQKIATELPSNTITYTIPESFLVGKSTLTIYISTRIIETGDETTSNLVNFTYSPKYTAPSGLKTNGSGSQAIVSWTAGTTTYGTMKYDVYANGTKIASNITQNSFTILESTLENLNKTVTIYITYKVAETGVSGQLSSVSFTYVPSVIKHTVGYRQGGRNHNCLVYINVSGAWIKCAPYVYVNGQWQICSTT